MHPQTSLFSEIRPETSNPGLQQLFQLVHLVERGLYMAQYHNILKAPSGMQLKMTGK